MFDRAKKIITGNKCYKRKIAKKVKGKLQKEIKVIACLELYIYLIPISIFD